MEICYDIDQESFYEIYEFHNSISKYKTSENEYRICRYCGNNSLKKFNSKAHLLPEFIGNKTIFSYNECDDCNKKFGLYETNLSAFSGIKNSFLPIKGKKKYPKFKDFKNNLSVEYQKDEKDGKVVLRSEKDSDSINLKNGFLNIKSVTQSFVPLYVQKSLVKFAISLIAKEELDNLTDTIDWINTPTLKKENNIPLLLIYNEVRPPLKKPIAFVAKRKKDCNSPEFSFILCFGFHRIQIFIPFNSKDKNMNKNEIRLPLNFDFVLQKEKNKGDWAFVDFDMNDLGKRKLTDNFSLKFVKSE